MAIKTLSFIMCVRNLGLKESLEVGGCRDNVPVQRYISNEGIGRRRLDIERGQCGSRTFIIQRFII